MNENRLSKLNKIIEEVNQFDNTEIEASVVDYFCRKNNYSFFYNKGFEYLNNAINEQIINIFIDNDFALDLEFVIEFFELLLEKNNVNENGIVFTPKYIADYIGEEAVRNYPLNEVNKVIDPGCGCGIFLVSFAELIHRNTGESYRDIVNDYIYGLDIDVDNTRRCKIVLSLLLLQNGESNEGVYPNIKCLDSLKVNWCNEFDVDSFNYIIGNPPYVNPHDMAKETTQFLKKNFKTTRTGVYNIFYAFIEYAFNFMNDSSVLSYIVPNNFLTIKAAADLREFISVNKYLESIIDFADNMVFKPVRTYNCIIRLSKRSNDNFNYCVMDKCDDIELELSKQQFDSMPISKLDVNGWKLVDKKTMSNLNKIESQFHCIKDFIRTGIATLRDEVYTVEYNGDEYYKINNEKKYIIEKSIVKRMYKIPELKNSENIQDACKYIIFPYKKSDKGFSIIDETEFIENYPGAYNYLNSRKADLDSRDKGKPNPVAWYAYGRTQGLTKFGKKLVFPTFANKPRFTMVDDEYAFFCNGYAVFENDYIDLSVLQKILNSVVMHYYVNNTSYAIEGGYYCYQKKYIEKFSIPYFDEKQLKVIDKMSEDELNEYLIEVYKLEDVKLNKSVY